MLLLFSANLMIFLVVLISNCSAKINSDFCAQSNISIEFENGIFIFSIECKEENKCDLSKLPEVPNANAAIVVHIKRCRSFDTATVIQKHNENTLKSIIELTLEANNIFDLNEYEQMLNYTTQVQQVSVIKNKIEHFPPHFLSVLPHLKKLNLRNNRLRLFDLCKHDDLLLTHLDLGKNNLNSLMSIPTDSNKCHLSELKGLSELSGLIELRIDDNNIGHFESETFSKWTKLEYIDLSKNNFTSLPLAMLSTNNNLTTFKLNNNKATLKSIPSGFLANKPKLETVEMSGCNIETLPDDLLENSINLKHLILSHNNLWTIDKQLLNDKENLETLDLSYNSIMAIDQNYFQRIKNIQKILLNNNLLEAIEPFVLKTNNLQDTLLQLEELNLSFNRISSINFTQIDFTQQNAMLRINLTHNQIKAINFPQENSISTGNAYGNEINIYLDDNPVHCDCDLVAFIRFWKEGKSAFKIVAENLECASPVDVKGQRVGTLNTSLMNRTNLKFKPTQCLYTFRCFDSCLVINCSDLQLKTIPDIEVKLTEHPYIRAVELSIQHNNITNLQDLQKNPIYKHLGKLFARNNQINEIENLPQNLTHLDLRENNLNSLNLSREVAKLSQIFLSHNPWQCECNFIMFLIENINHVMDYDWITCDNKSVRTIRLADLCTNGGESNDVEIIVIVLLAILTVVAFLVGLYYKYQRNRKIRL